MTDSEILKNYAFMPMYVISVINYQGSRKERYLFVTKTNSDDGKIGYLECLDEGELLFELKYRMVTMNTPFSVLKRTVFLRQRLKIQNNNVNIHTGAKRNGTFNRKTVLYQKKVKNKD